jgi:hypothetical protein
MNSLRPACLFVILLLTLSLVPTGFESAYAAQQPGDKVANALELTFAKYKFDFVANSQWFKIYVKTGQKLSIQLTVPKQASLDLYLYSPDVDPDGLTGLVASSSQWKYADGNESIVYTARKGRFSLQSLRLDSQLIHEVTQSIKR